MEKLQAAIERARLQRQGDQPVRPSAVNTPAAPQAGVWGDLPMLTVPERKLKRSRIFVDPAAPQSTHYDLLRTKIIQQCRDNGWRRIVITSATRGCGKTTTCLNLAASFGRQRDRRLLMLEFDMRRPEMTRLLHHRGTAGWENVLDGTARFEDVAVRFGDNVTLAMNRGPYANPSRVILADTTPKILEDIDARYAPDYVILDTPPMLATDDTLALLKFVDCAIVVARAESTTTAQVDVVEKEIAEITNVMGVVLNSCRYMGDTYGETYGAY